MKHIGDASDASGNRQHFRVVWKREGLKPKAKRYVHRVRAERFLNILTSPEPWKFYVKPQEADDYFCCSGQECGCGGVTVREEAEEKFKDLPKLEWARIDSRKVTPWEKTGVEFAAPKAVESEPTEIPF